MEQFDEIDIDLEEIVLEAGTETLGLSFDEQVDQILTSIVRKESHLSFSSMKAFMESPAEFIRYKMKTRTVTPAMEYGSMLHCFVLEPDDFLNRYFPVDDVAKKLEIGGAKPGATNAFKDWRTAQEQLAKLEGKKMVLKAEMDYAEDIAQAVKFNKASSRILKLCEERETPVEWDFKNFKFKGIMDLGGEDSIADLKSCKDANPEKFQRDIRNMGYHIQGAMYREAEFIRTGKKKDYYIIAVDKKKGISVHQLGEDLLELGLEKYSYYTDQFNRAIISDSFDQSHEFFAERRDGIYNAKKLW